VRGSSSVPEIADGEREEEGAEEEEEQRTADEFLDSKM
jgi:hypothetical protein